jgi:hypothetical protein
VLPEAGQPHHSAGFMELNSSRSYYTGAGVTSRNSLFIFIFTFVAAIILITITFLPLRVCLLAFELTWIFVELQLPRKRK